MQYLAHLPVDRRAALETIQEAILNAVPSLEARMNYEMLAYGRPAQLMKSGDDAKSGVVALASQKNYISLYLGCGGDDAIFWEENKGRLGKFSVGQCCVRFKKLEHLNLPVAMELLKKAAQRSAAG